MSRSNWIVTYKDEFGNEHHIADVSEQERTKAWIVRNLHISRQTLLRAIAARTLRESSNGMIRLNCIWEWMQSPDTIKVKSTIRPTAKGATDENGRVGVPSRL